MLPAYSQEDTLIVVKRNGKCGLVDTKGNRVLDLLFDSIKPNEGIGGRRILYSKAFKDATLITVFKDGKYGCVNLRGEMIIPYSYDDINVVVTRKGMFAIAEYDNCYGVLNAKGKITIPFNYSMITNQPNYNDANDAFFSVRKNGMWGMSDSNGNIIVPIEYNHFEPIGRESGLRCVQKNGSIGFVDRNWKTVVPFVYDGASFFYKNGLAIVGRRSSSNTVNIDHKFDTLYPSMTILSALEVVSKDVYGVSGIFRQYLDGAKYSNCPVKWGVIDGDGNEIIPLEYDNIFTMPSGYMILEKNNNYGLAHNQNIILPCDYTMERIDLFFLDKKQHHIDSFTGKYGTKFNMLREQAYSDYLINAMCVKSKQDKKIGIHFFVQKGFDVVEHRETERKFDALEKVYCGCYILRLGSKYGAIDLMGNTIVPFEFNTIKKVENKIVKPLLFASNTHINRYYGMDMRIYVHSEPNKTLIPVETGMNIEWIGYKSISSTQNYSFEIAITSKSVLKAVNIVVNGSSLRALSAIPDDGYEFRKKYSVMLKPGINNIRIEVSNQSGFAISEKTINYNVAHSMPISNERRIAFIVGNDEYMAGNALHNSVNDAQAVAEKLQSIGFDVDTAFNLTKHELEIHLNRFALKAKGYSMVVFYYAGHGMAINGRNYIIPAKAVLDNETTVKYNCIEVSSIINTLKKSGCITKFIILDACRNNIFSEKGLDLTSGFDTFEDTEGTIILNSTSLGKTAFDGDVLAGHSPFGAAFLKTLSIPNLDEDDFIKEVTRMVKVATEGAQIPSRSSSFTGTFIINQN